MPFLSRTFCCCAVPLYRIGAFSILAEAAVVGVTVGVLCLAGPGVQAAALPGSFASILLGLCCLATGFLQSFGFYAVYKDKRRLFKLFQQLNLAGLGLTFLLAAVWIVVSGVRRDTAVDGCVAQFYMSDTSSTSSARSICNIFCYVQLGIMAFVWLFFFLVQGYFCLVLNVYANQQRRDHTKFASIYFAAESEKHKDSLSYQRASINSSDDLHNPQPLYTHQHQPNASVSSLRNEVEPEPGSYVEKQYAGAGAYYSDERAEQQRYGDAPQQNPARWQPQTQAMGGGYRVRNQEAHPSLRPAQGAYDPFAAQQQQQSYGTGYVPDDYTEASHYRQH